MNQNIYKIIVLLVAIPFTGFAQIGIGTDDPSESAALEVSSQINNAGDYKGLMPPRVPTDIDRDAIATTATDVGLMVFVTETNCIDMFNGTEWEHVKCFDVPDLPSSIPLWINEIHYDNAGVDSNEFVEIAGVSDINYSSYSLQYYDATGALYHTDILEDFIIDDESGTGFGAVSFDDVDDLIGIVETQGAIALVDDSFHVIQFLSYGGVVTASEGPASGMNSKDIGVTESDTTAPDNSLQLKGGPGSTYSNFFWETPSLSSPGEINVGQQF